MKGFCPSCEKESQLIKVQRVEELNIRDEVIPVEVEYFHCEECGAEFDDPLSTYDPLDVAYREYRHRKGYLQPEKISAFREKYGLTQRELSELLGLGGATLSRYENGALQDELHDKYLQLAMEPQNLLQLIQDTPGIIEASKGERVILQLIGEIERSDLLGVLRRRSSYRTASILNGNREVDIDRVLNSIKVLCYHRKVPKTKLNKLLFYSDFLDFKRFKHSITGLCYARLPFGPVPDQYESIYQRLVEIDPALENEEFLSGECSGETYSFNGDLEQVALSKNELQILIEVREFFREYSSVQITEYSHDEEGYKKTENSMLISYQYAESLRI